LQIVQRFGESFNNLNNRYNDSLKHIDLSVNSQIVANVLQFVQRFGESSNDLNNHYNNSLKHIDLSENSQIVANVLQIIQCLNESYNDSKIVIMIPNKTLNLI
jgi:citrate lyase synthetase